MKNLFYSILLVTQLINGQDYSVQEAKIYNAIDVFVSKPDAESLRQLEITEKGIYPKSKKEILAYVILKCNKGYYQNQLGLANQAIVSYEQAWQLFQTHKLSNYDIVDSCLQPLGNLYTSIGDYGNAENIIKSYYFNATIEKNQQQKYSAVLNLTNVFQTTGRLKEAIDLLQKTIQTEVLTSTQKGTILNNLGNAYFLSSKGKPMEREAYSKAEKSFLASVTLLKGEPTQSKELSNVYRNLAVIYSESNRFDLANSCMEKAIKAFFLIPNGTPREQAKLYFENAKLYFQQNDMVNAEINLKAIFSILISNYTYTKNILPNKNSLYAETTLLDALDLQAEIYMSSSQPLKALDAYQLSFQIESLLQSLLVYENSKIITQLRNRNRTEKCLDIYYSLYQKEKNITYIKSAFLLSEATKSIVLKEHLVHSKTISKQEKLIHSQLQYWNTIILKEQQKLDLADVTLINKAIQKQNGLMLKLKTMPFNIETKSTQVLPIAKLFAKLEKDNAVMVEYFFGNQRIYVFTLEQDKIKVDFIKVGDTTTQKLVQFIDFFSDANTIVNNPIQYNQCANSTYGILKLPSKNTLKNLIIVPDGLLTFLPFEALITEKKSTTNFAKMHYLLYDFKVGYSNSAIFYLELKPFQHSKESVLGVFPIFENSPLELAYSKKELESIKRNFDGLYLEKNKATFTNFKYNAPKFSILHLSTHANSGDIYSPASIQFYDQEIVYSELYDLNIKPDLIVLSACETGIGKLYKAEGAMSIARGFQFAGAQNLLFSLWKVNDYTTSLFMDDFYKNCKKTHSYFDANHQAKLDYLVDETIPNSKKSPYYWSAMVYYGTLESKSATPSLLYVVVLIISCLGLFLMYTKKRSKYAKKQ
jgi:CHAT domain-containing protein